MKKKTMSIVMALAMAASLIAGCGSSGSASSDSAASTTETAAASTDSGETVKIGVLLSTTGSFSISETPMRNAAEMAINEINEAGGIDGKQIEAIYDDYGSDPSMAAEKAQELILKDEVCAIIGTNSSSTRLAVIPTIEQYDSLLIYNTFYEGETPSPNVLYTNTVPSQQVDPLIPYILENLGTKVYFIGSDYEFPRNAISYAKDLLEASGGEIVGEEYVESGATDFSSSINKIKQADPDVVFSVVAGNSTVSFLTDYEQYGMDMTETPVVSLAAHESSVKSIGDAAIGVYSCFSYYNTLDTEANKAFVEKYESLYGTDTTVTNSAEKTYASLYLLKAAIEKAGSTAPADIIAAAAGIEFEAPSGTLKMDETNHHAWLNTYIGQVQDDLSYKILQSSDGLVEPIVGE